MIDTEARLLAAHPGLFACGFRSFVVHDLHCPLSSNLGFSGFQLKLSFAMR